jgi:hypothetical protein
MNGQVRGDQGCSELFVKVALSVAPTARRFVVAPVLAPEALNRRLCFQQRPVHREVIGRLASLNPRLGHTRRKELRRDLALQQPVPVPREARWSHAGSSTPDPRTGGTEGRTLSAPSVAIPTGCRRTLAVASPATKVPARSTVVPAEPDTSPRTPRQPAERCVRNLAHRSQPTIPCSPKFGLGALEEEFYL